jgi:hypothetical protein
MSVLTAGALCDELVDKRVTALLLLVGYPEPAVSIVKAVRHDRRLPEILIGAPAGQPEFAGWATLLGADGAGIPFLRYLPTRLTGLGARAATALRERLGEAISVWQWAWAPVQVVDRDPADPDRFRNLVES